MNEPVVVGELVAGHASKVLAEVTALIKGVNTSTFDLAEKLHEVKAQKYYVSLGFDTFAAYTKSLDLRPTKSYYLSRIVEIMQAAGVARSEYEAVGIAKLRLISKLNVFEEGKPIMYGDLTMAECIKAMVEKAHEAEPEQVAQMVAKLQGKTGDDEMVWLNIAVTRIVRDNIVRPALDLAKAHIGTVGKDSDGIAIEPSDGRALEVLAVEFLNDPANERGEFEK